MVFFHVFILFAFLTLPTLTRGRCSEDRGGRPNSIISNCSCALSIMKSLSIVLFLLYFPCISLAHDHPPGLDSDFLNKLERPDNDKYPSRRLPGSLNSHLCCTNQDAVKVQYRVERQGGSYPQDVWYVWFKDKWTKVDPEKVSPEYAPSGHAYIFILGETIQCFVRPKGDF